MKYSIWIIPPEPIYSKLKSIIDDLASKHDAPKFEPHLTLVSMISMDLLDLEKTVSTIAKETKPFEISLGPVSCSTTYFQNVFVRADSSAELLSLKMQFQEELNLPQEMYMPHLSLFYANNSMEERVKISKSFEAPEGTFIAESLVINPAVPDPKDWYHAANISFSK